jgi:hypothetical protein
MSWRAEAVLLVTKPDPVATLQPRRCADATTAGTGRGQLRVAFKPGVHDTGRAVVVPMTDATSAQKSVLQVFQTADLESRDFAASRTIPHAWPIRSVAWAGNALVVGASAGRLAVLNVSPDDDDANAGGGAMIEVTLPNAKPLREIRVPPSAPATSTQVAALQMLADGTLAAASGATVHVFAAAGDPEPRFTRVSGTGSVITCLALAGEAGQAIATGSVDGHVVVADARTATGGLVVTAGGRRTATESTRCSARAVEDIHLHPHLWSIMAVTRADGSAQVFDTRCLARPLLEIPTAVSAMASRASFVPCSPDLLVVGSSAGLVRLWSLRESAPRLLGTVASTGDSVCGLDAVTINDIDSVITVDRSGTLHTANITIEYLRSIAPPPVADIANLILKRPTRPESVAARRKFADAASALYTRDVGLAADALADGVRRAVTAGESGLASKATLIADAFQWSPPMYADFSDLLSVPKAAPKAKPAKKDDDDDYDGTEEEEEENDDDDGDEDEDEDPEVAARRREIRARDKAEKAAEGIRLAARALLAQPYAITTSLVRYASEHPCDRTRDRLSRILTLSKSSQAQLDAALKEVGFVRALEDGNAAVLAENLAQLVAAIAQARLDPSLITSAAKIFLENMMIEDLLRLLTETAQLLAHGEYAVGGKTVQVGKDSLPHVNAVLSVLLDPMVATQDCATGSDWLAVNVHELEDAAAMCELVHAWVSYDAGIVTAADFVTIVEDFGKHLESPTAAATVPSPGLVAAVINASLEVHPDDLVKVCQYVEDYGNHCSIRAGPSGGLDAGAAEGGLDPAESEGELRDIATAALDAHFETGGEAAQALAHVAENIHATSTTQRIAAEARLEAALEDAVKWLEVSLALRTHLAARDGSGGCVLVAPVWAGYDPLEPLEGVLVEIMDAWAGLLAEVAEDRPLRSKVLPFVERVGSMVEGLVTDNDVDLDTEDGAMLSAILETCGEYIDAGS